MSSQRFESVLDNIGILNPQLLREWQGRLRGRNLLLTAVLSVVGQLLVFINRFSQLPVGRSGHTQYCVQVRHQSTCRLDIAGQPTIDWPFVWADIFHDLSFVLVWGLIVGGVYLLAADLSKETRRGTLNFLRMSPLSGRAILIGKLLGVPILLYVGIATVLPLHLVAGLMGSYPLGTLLAFYGLLAAIAFCFYAAALWFALLAHGLQGFQTWLIAGLSAGLLTLSWNFEYLEASSDWFHLFNPLFVLSDWEVHGIASRSSWTFYGSSIHGFRDLGWFFLPVGNDHRSGFVVFSLIHALLLGLWFWSVLERKFQTPTKTALGKRQSYGLTLFLSLLMLGFNLQRISSSEYNFPDYFWSYGISLMFWCVLLVFLLLPSKQSLLDWARYRHQQPSPDGSRRRQGIATDLLYRDASPSPLAYIVNLGIMGAVLLGGMGIASAMGWDQSSMEIFLIWFFGALVFLLCALVAQWMALSNFLHWRWLAVAAVAAIVVGWPITLAMAGVDIYEGPANKLWLTTAFSYEAVANASWIDLISMTMVQFSVLCVLSWALSRRIQVLGQSEWKALMDKTMGRPNLS